MSQKRRHQTHHHHLSVLYSQNACWPIFILCCRVEVMSGWLSHWAFSAGPYFHSILYLLSALCLSKRPLKLFIVGAVTTSSGRLSHSFTTLLLKKFCRNWILLLLFASFKLWPRFTILVTKTLAYNFPNVNWFSKIFSLIDSSKFATNLYWNMPPHLICVATLPCEICIISEKWWQCVICIVINDKSQGSIAKHLSCDGLFHYKCIIQFACEGIFKIGEHLAKL